MAHRGVGREHRVLVAAEVAETVRDEAPERGQRLPPGDGEAARAVAADERDLPVTLPAVEVVAHLVVDLVLGRAVRGGHLQGRTTPWRRLAVVVVEVPRPPGGLVTVHEQLVATADPPVEALHPQTAARVLLRPRLELRLRQQEAAGREDVDPVPCGHEVQRGAGGRVADRQAVAAATEPRLRQPVRVGLGLYVADPVTQFGRPVPHRGEDQMGLGPVEAASAQHGPGLDHQDGGVCVRPAVAGVQEVGAELVPEEPVGAWCHEVRLSCRRVPLRQARGRPAVPGGSARGVGRGAPSDARNYRAEGAAVIRRSPVYWSAV